MKFGPELQNSVAYFPGRVKRRGAGMYAIGVEGHEPLTQADMTIKSFEELNVSERIFPIRGDAAVFSICI